jgi:hypothetical protein
MAQRKVITPEEIVYTTEKDLLDQDYEVNEWERRFKELESEWRMWWMYVTFTVALTWSFGWPDDFVDPTERGIGLVELFNPLNQMVGTHSLIGIPSLGHESFAEAAGKF